MAQSDKDEGMETFLTLSDQLSREIRKLHQQNGYLRDENKRLKSEIDKMKNSSDIFSELPEKQKMVLKKQIGNIIERIDQHLGETNEVN